jgi:dihydrodipicolinate synthase/N-acetylneuraminate lyase
MVLRAVDLPPDILSGIRDGLAIPAHPLALDASRRLDERRQRAITRYYLDAGAGGIAVGVHTTQFAIRDAGLHEPVLRLARDTVETWADRPITMVAGVAGPTIQACREADIAASLDYHAGLLSLAAMRDATNDELIEHCAAVASHIPLFGFYLQPAVGGRHLNAEFWRRFSELDNVIAIKIAPFNRYRTLDVVDGVVAAGAEERVTLYTGNDDHIVLDLITPFVASRDGDLMTVHITGGLLGHWSVWTKAAMDVFDRCRRARESGLADPALQALDSQITAMNAALFDVANDFHGCIAGCHEVLRRQGLLEGIWCLDPGEGLSPGQAAALDRVTRAFPHLTDDNFVAQNLERWLE